MSDAQAIAAEQPVSKTARQPVDHRRSGFASLPSWKCSIPASQNVALPHIAGSLGASN